MRPRDEIAAIGRGERLLRRNPDLALSEERENIIRPDVCRRLSRAALAATCFVSSLVLTPAHADTAAFYVSTIASPGGDGSPGAPFNTLAAAEQASAPGDTIVVLPAPRSAPPLDGGIALKPRQRLIGAGPPVVSSRAPLLLPRITNRSGARNAGDAVVLADDVEVANIVVTDSYRGGIYGFDVAGVKVRGNDVSAHNRSCTPGFQILPIVAPTTVPGVGVPFGVGAPVVGNVYVLHIQNGWAGIMLDGTHVAGNVSIDDNRVHDSDCGDGIDIRLSGSADLVAQLRRNHITRLRQGHFEPQPQAVGVDSLLAMGFQTDDSSRLEVDAVGNSQTYIGSEGSDCEGLFADLAGSSTMIVRIDRNTFAHGIGTDSCNGMEMITGDGNPTADMRISNSTFEDDPGDMMEAGNLGVGSKMRLELDHVSVKNTTIAKGNDGPIPFNIGECLLAGNSGAGNVLTVRVRNSELTGCNNGVAVGSNVAAGNGIGPAESVTVDISNSRIHHNKYYNLAVRNLTALNKLSVRVENTDLSNAGETAVAIDQDPTALTLNASVDLGGGALGSVGHNCLFGSAEHDAETTRYEVVAKRNWWGSATGPGDGKTSANPPVLASLTYDPVLQTAPAACRPGATVKPVRVSPSRARAHLPATGLPGAPPIIAGFLLGAAAVLVRWQMRS